MNRKFYIFIGISILAFLGGNISGAILYPDRDKDGYLAPRVNILNFTEFDCNDKDPLINPAAGELPNNRIDEDCDGVDLSLPENLLDGDNDGFTPSGGDCNDLNGSIYPAANEVDNDGIDSNCDGKDSELKEEKSIILMQNVITPVLENRGRNSTQFVKHIGGKVLLVPDELESAHLSISLASEKIIDAPQDIAVSIYIETDVIFGERNYWEYDSRIGTAFDKISSNACGLGLIDTNEFILDTDTQTILTLPLIDMSNIPLSYDRDNPDADWPCFETNNVDLLNLINNASRYGKSVKIGFYTSAPGFGKILEAKLIYKGKDITVIQP